jgi:hypothetical protein
MLAASQIYDWLAERRRFRPPRPFSREKFLCDWIDGSFCIGIVERVQWVEEAEEDARIRSATEHDADFGEPRAAAPGHPLMTY